MHEVGNDKLANVDSPHIHPPMPSFVSPVLKSQIQVAPGRTEHNSPTSFHSDPDDVRGYILFINALDWFAQANNSSK